VNQNINQMPEEINKIIDAYVPYEKLLSIPKDKHLLHFLNITGTYIFYSRKKIFYIGCSGNLGQRIKLHFGHSGGIGKHVTHIKIIRFKDWWSAARVEAELIDKLNPVLNKINQYLKYYPADAKFTKRMQRDYWIISCKG